MTLFSIPMSHFGAAFYSLKCAFQILHKWLGREPSLEWDRSALLNTPSTVRERNGTQVENVFVARGGKHKQREQKSRCVR